MVGGAAVSEAPLPAGCAAVSDGAILSTASEVVGDVSAPPFVEPQAARVNNVKNASIRRPISL